MGLASLSRVSLRQEERERNPEWAPPPQEQREVTGAKAEHSCLGQSLLLGLLAVLTAFQGSALPPDFHLRL